MSGNPESQFVPAGQVPVRVLVIDDDAPVRDIVRSLLSEAGCLVETASGGHEGLQLLLRQDFDVAVVDLRMPDMGGARFLYEARSIWPWLGIVIITGFATDPAIDYAQRVGVRHILAKPLNARQLRDSVLAEAQAKRGSLAYSAAQSFDHIQAQLAVLREFSDSAIAADNLEAAMRLLGDGLARLLPCSAVGMLHVEAGEEVLYLNAVKPVAQSFIDEMQELMLGRYEALSGKPRPQQSLRIHADYERVTPDGATSVARTFAVPLSGHHVLRGVLTLALSAQDDATGRDATFLYYAGNHLATVMSALSRMRQLAVHDAMTGVYNRKGLEEEYARTWLQSRRYGFPLGVAIIDIDHFKQINDTHGHPAGDQVLREFAALTMRVARGTDIVARYGGDELVVILPQAGPAEVIAFGERLLDHVHRHIFCESTLNLKMTASVGVASSAGEDPQETEATLMARADKALYRAKQAGRDRVVLQQRDEGAKVSETSATAIPLDPARRAVTPRESTIKGRVLVVDDEPGVALLFARILKKQGYDVMVENNAADAIRRLREPEQVFDILLTDLNMPDKSGLELLDELRSIDENLIKIVVTGNATLDNAVLSLRRGAYDFIEKPVVSGQLVAVVERAMEYGRLKAENRRYQLHLEDMVREKSAALREALDRIRHSYDFTLEAMMRLLDARERSTGQHSLRVRDMAVILARALNLSESEIEDISRGALLHDIGKIAIPDHILLKPDRLSDDEREIMKTHAVTGYNILKTSTYLEKAAEIVLSHHESYDGTGYPRGLAGAEIPMGARIFAVVDTYDAMRSNRVYRTSITPEKVTEEIRRFAGRQFDPVVVEAFLTCQAAFERIGRWDEEPPMPRDEETKLLT